MRTCRSLTLVLLTCISLSSAQQAYCTSNSQGGECISTSSCASNGGRSDPANLCPGGNDIQCCTYGTCTNGAGQAGECVPTSACAGAGGSSDSGNFCPGGNDIQCCTYGSCTNSAGAAGLCQPAATCASPDAGNYCPGNQNIQCCASEAPPPPPPTGCGVPEANDATLSLIKDSESPQCSPSPYTDPTGNPTIGYGHLCQDSSCSDVKYSIPLSAADCDNLLQDDISTKAAPCVANGFTDAIVFNDNQYGAFIDFTFNLGCLDSDPPFTRINAGEDPATVVAQEFPKYDMGGGEVLPGLVKRRQNEINLFNTASNVGALPYTPCS